jgi:hypothetical protein
VLPVFSRNEKPAESVEIEPARPGLHGDHTTPKRIRPTGVGLPIGSLAPRFELPDLTGQERSLGSRRAEGKPIVLIFSSRNGEVPGATAKYRVLGTRVPEGGEHHRNQPWHRPGELGETERF